jgi:hypothetical protein
VREEGDIRYYTVTYEYPWLGEFFVNVTAIDSFGNGNEFQIASQDSVWERVTNKINTRVAEHLLGKLASPAIGFMTGLVYGLKDIVDFATGVVRFILDMRDQLESLMDVIKDCTPELRRPIQFPDACPIDLREIANEAWKGFVGLSPYNPESPAHDVFLYFSILGFATVILLSNSLAVKAFNKVRSASSTIDDIASGIGRIPSKVVGTLRDAIGSVSTSVKSGIPLAIRSAAAPAFSAMKSGASTVLKALGSGIGVVLSTVFVAIFWLPSIVVNKLDDVMKLILQAKSRGYVSDVTSPAYYAPVLHKSQIMSHMDIDVFYDFWAKSNNKKWQLRESITNSAKGASPLNFRSQTNSLGFAGSEIDGVMVRATSNGKPKVTIIESKQGYDSAKLTTIRNDLTTKGDNSIRPLRDKANLQAACSGLSAPLVDNCVRVLMGSNHPQFPCVGLTLEVCDNIRLRATNGQSGFSNQIDADLLAKCILGVRECDWEIKYDISGIAEFQPCLSNSQCMSLSSKLDDESAAAFVAAVDGAEDIAGTIYPPLAGGGAFSTQSTTFNYPPVKMGLGSSPVIAAIVLLLSISYLLNWRKLHPKRPEPSA